MSDKDNSAADRF